MNVSHCLSSPMARVMIAQWENECISLSILPKARVMIAQWENECISLFILPMARIMIAQWENECISLSVYLSVCSLCALGPIPDHGGILRGISLLADHTLPPHPEPAWLKMVQYPFNGTTQPVDIEEEGRSPIMDRQWLTPIKNNKIMLFPITHGRLFIISTPTRKLGH